MKQTVKNIGKHIGRIFRIIGIFLLVLTFFFGLLLLILGTSEQHTLNQAATSYTAVLVKITDVQPSAQSGQVMIVVLEPIGEPSNENDHEDSHKPNRLGTTAATTTNRSLSQGDVLTMYYDPANPDSRVIDFQTAKPLLWFGGVLTGGTFAIGMVLLLFRMIQRRKQIPATQISA